MDTAAGIAGADTEFLDEEEIFNQARRIGATEERLAFVARACGGDQRLRCRVEGLLRVDQGATRFLETPACGLTAISGLMSGHVPEVEPETEIGPYRLLEPLGEGGFGVVYRARQTVPVRREVALKLIKPGMGSGEVLARFEAERQALALMDHPHIARVLDAGQTPGGRPWFVMELVAGSSLCQFADGRRLVLRERLRLFSDVCAAVGHAHQKGIIHRDLKPSNLLVTEQDGAAVVKVIDFGIAKAIGGQLVDHPVITQQLQLVGTPAYMSPEQVDGSASGIDTRSDIYSLGVILYELLTGTTPVASATSGSLPELIERIRSAEPVKPSQYWGGAGGRAAPAACRQLEPQRLAKLCRDDLDWIVLKCLEKDRERRYPTANALREDIGRYLQGHPVAAGPPSKTYRLRKFVRRNRGWLAAATAIMVLIVAGSGVSLWQGWRAWRNGQQAEARRVLALQEKARAESETAVARAINDFLLTDLLSQSDSANQSAAAPRQRDLTVRELLDRAAKRIESRFGDQARTEAAVRLTVGESLAGLGEFGAADPHLRRAVELLAAELGADAAETLNARRKLAWNCRSMASHEEAQAMLEEVLAIQSRRPGLPDREALATQNMLVGVLQSSGQLQKALALAEQTWQSRLEQFGPDDPDTQQSFANMASLNLELGRPRDAIPQLREIVAYRRQRGGDDHPQTVSALHGLASALIRTGEYGEARDLLEEGERLAQGTMDQDHPRLLNLMNDLAILCEMEGDVDEAARLYHLVLDGRTRRLGPRHPDTFAARGNLATLLAAMGKVDEAEAMLRELVTQLRAEFGSENQEAILAINNLVFLLLQDDRPAEAGPLAEEGVAAAVKVLGLGHSGTQTLVHNQVLATLANGQSATVVPTMREVLKEVESRRGPDSLAATMDRVWLALALHGAGKSSEARALAKQAQGQLEQIDAGSWRPPFCLALQGAIEAARGNDDAAGELLDEGLAALRDMGTGLPPDARALTRLAIDWQVARVRAAGDEASAGPWLEFRNELSARATSGR